MSIKIRKAVESDIPFLAQMILQSSRSSKKVGIFDILFETVDDKKILQSLQLLSKTKAKSQTHYSNFLVAEVDNKLVGTLCSYEPRIATKEVLIQALDEVGFSDKISEKLEVIYNCDFKLNNRTLMFDYMEELEGFMDVGILKELMKKSLLTARLKGYGIAQTMVEIGSIDTLLLYKKLGFKEIQEQECELYKEKFGRNGLILLGIDF
ncbi:MAG: acyl-CoA acyltransferase [Campylobacterota bacterium]|nr:acyl-CoA acyltransferase [Campylobacterota bacterium]